MVLKFKNTRDYLSNYSKKLIKLLRLELNSPRVRSYPSGRTTNSAISASGSLYRSLKSISKDTKGGFAFNITGNEYGLNVDSGRKAGSEPPPVQDIIDWIKVKKITLKDYRKNKVMSLSDAKIKSIAYVISRSIGRNGIKPTSFLSDAIEKSMGDLNKLGAAVGKDVLLNVDDILLKAGYIKKGENYIIENGDK